MSLACVKLQGCGLGTHPLANVCYSGLKLGQHHVTMYVLTLSTGVDCTCGTLSDPVNGQVSHPSGTTFGQTATYTCDEGYILMGDITRMCQATRMWSGSEPSCQCEFLATVVLKECLSCGLLSPPPPPPAFPVSFEGTLPDMTQHRKIYPFLFLADEHHHYPY